AVLDVMQSRLDRMPDAMGLRRQTAEHVFGTLKAWAGSTPFLTRTLEKVRTEMSLAVLAYNMKRMIQLLGVRALLHAIRTCQAETDLTSEAIKAAIHFDHTSVFTQPRPKVVLRQQERL